MSDAWSLSSLRCRWESLVRRVFPLESTTVCKELFHSGLEAISVGVPARYGSAQTGVDRTDWKDPPVIKHT